MPLRLLRDWTQSEKVDTISVYAERFFTRLIMKADDYGCFYADARLLKANLFPLKIDSIREADLLRWIAECVKAQLIVLYESDNKRYLQIIDFRQRLDKAKAKFPLPDENTESLTTSTESMAEQSREIEQKKKENRKEFSPPSLDEFKAYFKENGFREDIAERAWNGYNVADWHDSKGNKVKVWKQKCQNVWFKDEHKIKDAPHQTSTRQKFLKKAIQILPDSLCVIFEDNFSGRCTPQEAMDFKAGKIDLSYFNREF